MLCNVVSTNARCVKPDANLRTLARVDSEVKLKIEGPVTNDPLSAPLKPVIRC